MKKGKLIIIESGTDGSGKATQTQKLYDKLIAEGKNVRKITFPNYDSPACMPVKMYLNGEFGTKPEDVNAYAASTFYAIDRYASYKTDWGEFYNNGGIILSDRYTTSNMVHQAVKMDNPLEREKYLNWLYELEFDLYGLPKPDCIVFLDLSPTISKKLMEDRANKFTGEQEKDIHEANGQYLVNCYNNSLEIANKYDWKKVKCNDEENLKSIDSISDEVYAIVREYL
ncbi:MAG: thymidylate kinase [Clostridium sp.]|uniref:dTMP kinase n=1 Tax=Clostridium sp. TaxID=1506 RepID=UPI002FC82FAE